ncbi:hypothetical protein [Amycolatopsis samaneae]|uniref:Uncharacterized protein n=1 Tax=Amycolatopsis samaneae TaxID=664691 RepID=A0ABW5GRU5_9PSEU
MPKRTEWRRLVRPLLPGDWRLHQSERLAYRIPVDWVLHGILADGSISGEFYLHRLHMPLTVPCGGGLDLTYSPRHTRGTQTYATDSPDLPRVLTEAIRLVEREAARRSVLRSKPGPVRGDEIRGYELLLAGRAAGAVRRLDRVSRYYPDGVNWVAEVQRRVAGMAALIRADPAEAVQCLEGWRANNLRDLKIVDAEAGPDV